jgi:lantibiotic modifying enzyme
MRQTRSNLWRPILDGRLYEQAVEAVQAIAASLQAEGEKAASSRKRGAAYSLAGGQTGQALFYAYLAEWSAPEKHRETAFHLLEQAVKALSATTMFPSLYSGFTGVAWAAEHMQSRCGNADEDDLNAAIDAALMELLDGSAWLEGYDLIRGLVGFGVYALERAHRPAAVTCLQRIITLLEALSEHTSAGIAWHTPPALLPDHHRAECPNGYYNLGLAHGIPGIIALLGAAYAAGVAVEKTGPLLAGAVPWLLAQRLTAHGEDYFPAWAWVAPASMPSPSRLAWCYGDLGLAAALLGAARGAQEPAWERAALDIALRATTFSSARARVQDAGLCHGAAGNAHLFNRFYHASGDERFKEAARFWFEQTLAMRRPGEGVGGFRAWKTDAATMQFQWQDDPGFLTGSAGIGLALLAAVTNVEPDWDRVLLSAIPPHKNSPGYEKQADSDK